MAACPVCKSDVPAGSRWCAICHSNVTNPAVGRLASPGKRLGAYFLDWVIPLGALAFIFGVGGLGVAASGERAGGTVGRVLAMVLFIVYVVWAIRLFAHGTTPGKRALGMYVVKEDGRPAGFATMLFREWIGKWISGLILGLGYRWILIDKEKQAWHDKLASTYVAEHQG